MVAVLKRQSCVHNENGDWFRHPCPLSVPIYTRHVNVYLLRVIIKYPLRAIYMLVSFTCPCDCSKQCLPNTILWRRKYLYCLPLRMCQQLKECLPVWMDVSVGAVLFGPTFLLHKFRHLDISGEIKTRRFFGCDSISCTYPRWLLQSLSHTGRYQWGRANHPKSSLLVLPCISLAGNDEEKEKTY